MSTRTEGQYKRYSTTTLRALRKVVGEEAEAQIAAEIASRIRVEPDETTTSGSTIFAVTVPQTIVIDDLPTSKNALHIPVTNKKTGKPMIVLTNAARKWKRDARAVAREQWAGPPTTARVNVTATFELPKGSKIDVINLTELLMDALEGVCYEDDWQIWDCHIHRRVTSGDPCTYITIEPQEW